MKKIFIILSAVLLLTITAGCGGGGGSNDVNTAPTIDEMTATMEKGAQYYKDQISGGATPEEAGNNTIAWLKKQVGVVDAVFDDDKDNILVEDETGITTAININDSYLNYTEDTSALKSLSSIVSRTSGSQSSIKSIILKPISVIGLNPDKVYDTLKSKSEDVTYLKHEKVTVQSFVDLKDYDIIYFFGHGIKSINKFTRDGERILAIVTGEPFTKEKMDTYNKELTKLGVPLITDEDGGNQYLFRFVNKDNIDSSIFKAKFAVTSLFIEAYSKNLKATIVYIDACHSLESDAMWDAFKNNGAKTYFGWNESVEPRVTYQYAQSIFSDLFNGSNAETAYNKLVPSFDLSKAILHARGCGKTKLPTFNDSETGWTQMKDFGGGNRRAPAGFTIGDKAYIGTGHGSSKNKKDFWMYDPCADTWTQKADFGGTARGYAVGFSIGSMGYIGTGYDDSVKKDFYEYNTKTNKWKQKKDFGGAARGLAVGFSIGNKGYIGTGNDGSSLRRDFWEYNLAKDKWTQKEDFGGVGRFGAVGFSIGCKGYIGTGVDVTDSYYNDKDSLHKDFWEYTPATNNWTKKKDFGGNKRAGAIGFSIGNKGYIGTGVWSWNGELDYYKDFWQYDPDTNNWTSKAPLKGDGRDFGIGLAIGSKGYMGMGTVGVSPDEYYKDFWAYDPGN